MEKEKKVFVETNKDKASELNKDFDISKLTRGYIQVAPFEELLRLFRSQTPEFWLNLTQSSENPQDFLILAVIAKKKSITQKVGLNDYIDLIDLISQNSKDLFNLFNLINSFNLIKIINKTPIPAFIIRIFERLLRDGLVEVSGTEPTGTKPASLYAITAKGLRRLFYYCLPLEEPKDLSETINELADDFIAFIEAYLPLNSSNAIDLKKMLEFSYPLFEFFKNHPFEFIDGLLPLVENRLDTKLPQLFCNFPGPDSFEYSSPRAEASGRVCYLEGNISSMSPPQNKIIEIQAVCPSCGANFAFSVVEQKPYLFCKLCGSPLKTISKKSEDYLVFTVRTALSDSDFTVEASCDLVFQIKRIFEQNPSCKLLAVLHSRPTKKGSNVENFYYNLLAIEPTTQKIEIVEDVEVLSLSHLIQRFCPAVVGLPFAKLALLASIVRSGRPREGRLNSILAGDSGVGKSYLIEQAQKYLSWLPVGFVDGGNASAVGVLGGAVRSDSGGWSIVRGALPQASGGLLFFEEMTNLSSESLDRFKESLESGKVCISKAGLNISFVANTTLISACNPALGTFNKKKPLFSQLPLSAPLLDRFDLKLALFQDDGLNKKIAKTMLQPPQESEDKIKSLQKYLFKAHSLNPSFSDEAKEFFVEHCKYGSRQNRALKNLSLAIAQLRLSSSVSVDDMQTAFDFVQKQNRFFFGDSDGYSFENSAQIAILQLLDSQKEPTPEDVLIKKLNPSDEILMRNVIHTLKEQGIIYQTAKGLSKV